MQNRDQNFYPELALIGLSTTGPRGLSVEHLPERIVEEQGGDLGALQ